MEKELIRARVNPEEAKRRFEALRLLHILRLAHGKPEKPSDIFVIFAEKPEEVFIDVMHSWNGLASLDRPLGNNTAHDYEEDNDEKTLYDIIPSSYPGTEQMALAQVWPQEIKNTIEGWIEGSGLTPKQKQAVRLYYFQGLSFRQVGQRLGHNNHQRACQLVQEGLAKIRKNPDVVRLQKELF